MKRKKNKEPAHIRNILGNVLRSFRHGANEEMTRVWELWEGTIGKEIAENAQPAAFMGDLLLVHVTSPAWIQHLQFMKKDIIHKLNHASGTALIRDIKFKVGPL